MQELTIVSAAHMERLGYELWHTGGDCRAWSIYRGSGLTLEIEGTDSPSTPAVLLGGASVCLSDSHGLVANLDRVPMTETDLADMAEVFKGDPTHGVYSSSPIVRELALKMLRQAWEEYQPDERRK